MRTWPVGGLHKKSVVLTGASTFTTDVVNLSKRSISIPRGTTVGLRTTVVSDSVLAFDPEIRAETHAETNYGAQADSWPEADNWQSGELKDEIRKQWSFGDLEVPQRNLVESLAEHFIGTFGVKNKIEPVRPANEEPISDKLKPGKCPPFAAPRSENDPTLKKTERDKITEMCGENYYRVAMPTEVEGTSPLNVVW